MKFFAKSFIYHDYEYNKQYNYPKWNFKSCVKHGSTNANLKILEAELATNAQEIWVNGPSVNEKPVNPKGKLLKFHKNSGKPTVS